MSIADLPIELLWSILSYLPPQSLLRTQCVCKFWCTASREEKLWKERFLSTFENWYDDIENEKPFRERFWKCNHIHNNWRFAKSFKTVIRQYMRTLRQIQVTDKYLALAYGDEIEIRDSSSLSELFHIHPDFRDTVPYLKCFHVHKSRLACSAGNGWTQINVFDLESEGKLNFGWQSIEPHPIEAIAFSESKLVTGSRKCIVWDLQTRTPVRTISEQQRGVVNCLQFDEDILVCSHKGRKVRIWDIKSGKRIYTIQGHQHLVHCLQYDNNWLATGSKDKTIRVWDRYKGYQCSAVLRGHTESVRALSIQGWRVVSGSKDGDVRIWDITQSSQSLRTSSNNNRLQRSSQNQSPSRTVSLPNLITSVDEALTTTNKTIEDEENPILVEVGGIRTRSLGRLAGKTAEPVFSVATSSTRLYVGTRELRIYDFSQPPVTQRKLLVFDKLRNMFS